MAGGAKHRFLVPKDHIEPISDQPDRERRRLERATEKFLKLLRHEAALEWVRKCLRDMPRREK